MSQNGHGCSRSATRNRDISIVRRIASDLSICLFVYRSTSRSTSISPSLSQSLSVYVLVCLFVSRSLCPIHVSLFLSQGCDGQAINFYVPESSQASRRRSGRLARDYRESGIREIYTTGEINAPNARKVHRHQEGVPGGWLGTIERAA